MTLSTVVEKLQRVIYDLHFLAASDNSQFTGIVLTEIQYTPPEGDPSLWRVTIEPDVPTLTAVEGDTEVSEESENVRTSP